jgi:hypothetical protein
MAMGDVDGDGDDELAIGRNAGGNQRYRVDDFQDGAWTTILDNGGTGWGDSRGVTAMAIPDTRADRDGDGLNDCWEVNGYDADGDGTVDVTLPGADPERRDVYVEIDCLEQLTFGVEGPHSHCPRMDALTSAAQAFADAPVVNLDGTTGIQAHFDVGPLFGDGALVTIAGGGGVIGSFGDFGAGNTIVESGNEIIDFDGAAGDPATDFNDLKDANFDDRRLRIYRYTIFGHQTNFRKPANDCTSGWAPGGEDHFLVTLGGTGTDGFNCYGSDAMGRSVGNRVQQAGTLLHELGHILRLAHGGTETTNNKPNYLSVMNYLFQMCAVPASPVQPGIPGGCDYSVQALPPGTPSTLDETALDECAGIDAGTLGYGPMNWDGGGFSGPTCGTPGLTVSADINGDGTLGVLAGAEDWNDIEYSFRSAIVGGGVDEDDGGSDPDELERVQRRVAAPLRPVLALRGPSRPVPITAANTITFVLRTSNVGGGPAFGTSVVGDGLRLPLGTIIATGSTSSTVALNLPAGVCTEQVDLSLRVNTADLVGLRHVDQATVSVPLARSC